MAEMISRQGNKVEFKVAVPGTEVSRAYAQVWSALSRDVRVPGFRPGKAPKSVIEKRVGTGYVENEVRDRLLQSHYPQAVRELKLNLVDAEIEPEGLKDGQTFEFLVKGETYPEVTLGDWKAIEAPASAPEITDEVLARTLSDLQERNATFEAVDRPIEATDMVTIQEAPSEDGEGGSYPVYLDVAEAHVRDALVGKNKGDVVEITVPAHSHGDHEHPAHSVTVTVQDVKHKQLQELNDDFAKGLNFDSLEKLRADLQGELERRAQAEGESARREAFTQALAEGISAEIPEAMLERRREAMLSEIKDDLSRQGVKWDEYEKFMTEQDKLADFMADLAKNAETRVRRDLALEKLAEEQGVQISDQEFNASLNALAQANRMSVQDLRNQLGPNGLNGYYATLLRDRGLTQALAGLTPASEAATETPEAEGQQAGGETGAATEEASTEQASTEGETAEATPAQGTDTVEQTDTQGETAEASEGKDDTRE